MRTTIKHLTPSNVAALRELALPDVKLSPTTAVFPYGASEAIAALDAALKPYAGRHTVRTSSHAVRRKLVKLADAEPAVVEPVAAEPVGYAAPVAPVAPVRTYPADTARARAVALAIVEERGASCATVGGRDYTARELRAAVAADRRAGRGA